MTRKKPFPGVGNQPVIDPSGKRRWRLRRTYKGRKINTYLPGAYGSEEFRTAYEAALTGAMVPKMTAKPGTIGELIETYLARPLFLDLKASTRKAKRLRLDWIKTAIGDAPYAKLKPHHVAKVMDKFGGPNAANRFKKDLSQLYDHAAEMKGYAGINPAKLAKAHKAPKGGHHTWTDAEIEAFRAFHPSGTLIRRAMELMLNTGAARVDVVGLGRPNVRDDKIVYRRQKTEGQTVEVIEVTVPILDELATELALVPPGVLLFLTHSGGKRYSVESFGNLFRDACIAAGIPGRAHGLRKAGARIMAEAGGTQFEVMAVLGHSTPKEAATYVAAANREGLATSGFAKVSTKRAQKLSNAAHDLDKNFVKGDR
ncbi:tyrosine-type recombinase/integrase [uncultured Jannaschia sp.]|uniref:site-specific integrase n=1 Tax=uncultured Jannaschia sp. TaxID=293347 RepID=UPI002633EFDE|nr:tyrosine-type recombinase/integrase [uncultured Jannaschia sp.]